MKRIYSIPCSSINFANHNNTSNSSNNDYFKWQTKKSKYLAVSNENVVNIYNRHGEHIDQINLFGNCQSFQWDENGEQLAIITNRSSMIFLWNSLTMKLMQIDTNIKEMLGILSWSKLNPSLLFIGTVKGNLLFYNNQTSRKISINSKHSKRIVSCCWNSTGSSNMIAVVGDDHVLTVNNEDGETLIQNQLKGDGSMVKFFHSYQDAANLALNKQLSSTAAPAANNTENSLCLVLNKRMLYMMNIQNSENSFILNFKDWYENIIDYYCYPNGNIFVAFTSGLIVTISTNIKNFGVELSQIKAHRESMFTLSVCQMINRVATCDENNVKIFDLYDHNDIENVFIVDDEQSILQIEWTVDGQLLALCSYSGNIHVYLSQLKIIGDNCGTSLAFLSSLLEVTIFNVHEDVQDSVMIVRIDIEPSYLTIGPLHLAIAMNNKIWLYTLADIDLPPIECEYTGIIKNIKLNQSYLAILFTNGQLHLHSIEQQQQQNQNNQSNRYFSYPDDEQLNDNHKKILVTSLCLTNEFSIFSTDSGLIIYFIIEDWQPTIVYRHNESIQIIQCNSNGTRLVLIDVRNDVYILNVFGEKLIRIPTDQIPSKPVKILWESWLHDHCVFTICDQKYIHVYSSPLSTINGPIVDYVGRMKIPSGQYPLLLYNGVVVCQTKTGKTSNFVLSIHDYAIKNITNSSSSKLIPSTFKRDVFDNILKLRRYQDAIKICNYLDSNDSEPLWIAIGEAALKDLDLNIGICVYQKLKRYTFVHCLQSYRNHFEFNLLSGFIAELLGDFDLAQKHFLTSTQPMRALEMRKNLRQWNEALALAKHLSLNDVPMISRELALTQELRQEYSKAMENFEIALSNQNESNVDDDSHRQICMAGIARNAIHCGDIKKAIRITNELTDQRLINECASIFEQLNYLQEAATLYEQCNQYNQAAKLYLKIKNTAKLSSIMSKIDDGELLAKYGQMKEAEKQYRQALDAYVKAKQWEDVVRVNLDYLNNPGEAVRIVRENNSINGAKLVAKFFQRLNDMTAAIEFLIISKCYDDAYNLALTTKQMDTYADIMEYHVDDILVDHHQPSTNGFDDDHQGSNHNKDHNGDNNNNDDDDAPTTNTIENLQHFRTIAIYYEQENDLYKAGKFYCLAKIWRKGVKLLLESTMKSSSTNTNATKMNESNDQSSSNNKAISLAIEIASITNDEQIIRMILDYLMGEQDGIPKDFKYLFRLYMKLKLYQEAAKTAIIIAREEQLSGNYRNSHQFLYQMCMELSANRIQIPTEMIFNLMLIHSYMLSKIWIRLGNHRLSSKLLIRVYDNINQFPTHSLQILTFVVIECMRAGYIRNALKYAYILMKQDNLESIDTKLKKKIENLIRKSSQSARKQSTNDELLNELNVEMNPCPYCQELLYDNEFVCTNCRQTIPFCIASGMHINLLDLTKCYHCNFPALKTFLMQLIQSSNSENVSCPMCEHSFDRKSSDFQSITSLNEIFNINDEFNHHR